MSALSALKRFINHRAGALPRHSRGRISALSALHPLVLGRISGVHDAMLLQGYDPIIFETIRTYERAIQLHADGTGSLHSFHYFGVAVDVISEKKKWSPGPAFWREYQKQCELYGLIHGAGQTRVDLPHAQGVPHSCYWHLQRATNSRDGAELEEAIEHYMLK